MQKNNIKSELSQVLKIKENRLKDESYIKKDLHIDSMKFILMITEIEKKFQVSIPDNEWFEIRTVGELVELIQNYQ